MRTIIVTGIAGVGKTTVLNQLRDMADEAKLRVTILNFGTVMHDILSELGKGMHRDEIRRQDIALQKKVQGLAADEITHRVTRGTLIVDTHMFIRTSTGLWSGLPEVVLHKLDPSLLVLIEAPPDEIAARRKVDKSRVRDEIVLDEISFDLAWSRATASSCSVLTGAPVRIIRNETGKQREAAAELLQLVREHGGG